MMDTAYVWSLMSKCTRKKVGSVLSKDGRIVSIGYNGTPAGCKDNTGEYLDSAGDIVSSNKIIHAEANSILFAAKNGISTKDCILYVTLSPCVECSKMIIQSGIKEVVYSEEYRDRSGIDFLSEYIKVRKI